ncbi:MAG: hypothetical protein MJY94_01920 [Bacteroidales bacterium]|nr:hypothetical protein [Bacteroidales bacterium]
MKKIFIILASLIVAFSACSKLPIPGLPGNDPEPGPEPEEEIDNSILTIDVTLEDLACEDGYDASMAASFLNWTAGDRISVINLSTGNILGGDLVTEESGKTVRFSGSLKGYFSEKDHLAFIYPSQGFVEEEPFSVLNIDLTHQTGSLDVPLVLCGDNYRDDESDSEDPILFTPLVSCFKLDIDGLKADDVLQFVRINDMGSTITLFANDSNTGLNRYVREAAPVIISSEGIEVGADGKATLYFSAFSSPVKYLRKVDVATRDQSYKAEWVGDGFEKGHYYESSVSGVKELFVFEDSNFEKYILDNFDSDGDGKISQIEADRVRSIELNTDNIESLYGIKNFVNLRSLAIKGRAAKWMEDVDSRNIYSSGPWNEVLNLPDLKGTSATGKLKSLDVSGMANLSYLSVRNNMLEELNIDDCYSLTNLDLSYTRLSSISCTIRWKMESLSCSHASLYDVDFSNYFNLQFLDCSNNYINTIDISNSTQLWYLACSTNQITSLDVSNNTMLTNLHCSRNQLSDLDVSNNVELDYLSCSDNKLTSLDTSKNTKLRYLLCYNNQLTDLDVSNNVELDYLSCSENKLTSLDLSDNAGLRNLDCNRNELTSLDVSKTNLGNSNYQYPLSCAFMPSLKTLKLHAGWEIEGINKNRSAQYIGKDTEIIYD